MTAPDPYSELVTRLFRETPGAGRPSGPKWVGGEATEPLSGSMVRWHLRAAASRIEEARYEVRGCPHTIAATALIAAELAGRPIAAVELDLPDIARRLGAPVTKLGRFFVIQDALRKALLLLEPRTA
jgi:NifU-like protein involved in Fe-S cluster formation